MSIITLKVVICAILFMTITTFEAKELNQI